MMGPAVNTTPLSFRPEHQPIHLLDTQFPSCRLDVPCKNVVVTYRTGVLDRLEHQIVGPSDFTAL
jgi:hypothetical protein